MQDEPKEQTRRPPSLDDIRLVLSELAKHGVEYAMLGGAAMAVHGFPRMTKDIDLIFPVDPENNDRLLAAIEALKEALDFTHMPSKESLDEGYSTAAEGKIGIDILFVAASKKFDDYKKHIEERDVGGVKARVLDIDGMLMSKETDRPEDIPDRQRLMRLKP